MYIELNCVCKHEAIYTVLLPNLLYIHTTNFFISQECLLYNYAYAHMNTCTHAHMHARTRAHTHTHTHTSSIALSDVMASIFASCFFLSSSIASLCDVASLWDSNTYKMMTDIPKQNSHKTERQSFNVHTCSSFWLLGYIRTCTRIIRRV